MPTGIQVAIKRVSDNVPLHIRYYLLHAFVEKNDLPRVIHDSIAKDMAKAGEGEGQGQGEGEGSFLLVVIVLTVF